LKYFNEFFVDANTKAFESIILLYQCNSAVVSPNNEWRPFRNIDVFKYSILRMTMGLSRADALMATQVISMGK
jgi:hypothetical protein